MAQAVAQDDAQAWLLMLLMAVCTLVFDEVSAELSALIAPLMLLSMEVTRSWLAPVIGQGHCLPSDP